MVVVVVLVLGVIAADICRTTHLLVHAVTRVVVVLNMMHAKNTTDMASVFMNTRYWLPCVCGDEWIGQCCKSIPPWTGEAMWLVLLPKLPTTIICLNDGLLVRPLEFGGNSKRGRTT